MTPDAHAIDALLPQTQCTQCGFDGCLPYAEAIASGEASINRCPPGGDEAIHRLAALTRLPYAPLDPLRGIHRAPMLAVVDETRCIGCTICIQKCPVDAIVGAAKSMHTVIAAQCTGCELCVAPCPVDCIELVPMPAAHPWVVDRPGASSHARDRYRARAARLARSAAHGARAAHPAHVANAADALHATHATHAAHATADAGHLANDARPRHERDTPIAGPGADIAGGRDDHSTAPIGSDAHKRDAIAAALARARMRREAASQSRATASACPAAEASESASGT
jgi:electron transport complex protein RnfB